MIKQSKQSMSDYLCQIRAKKNKRQFFEQLEKVIDWNKVEKKLGKIYKKTFSVTGRPAYSCLLLFKMCLLQTWYGLSDYEIEERVNDSISFSYFCGLSMEDVAPDHSTLCRFRQLLNSQNYFEKMLNEINQQLEKNGVLIKRGIIVDATVIETPHKPKSKPSIKVTEDRQENPPSETEIQAEETAMQYISEHEPRVDTEARWLKKGKQVKYGYKSHTLTNDEGLILHNHITAANVNEISNLDDVLAGVKLPKKIPFYADKGYQSAKNNELMESNELINRIQKKAKKNKPLTKWEVRFNKLTGKVRFKIERTFGSIKRWFNAFETRYRGIKKTKGQMDLQAIAYNLYRTPGIVISKKL